MSCAAVGRRRRLADRRPPGPHGPARAGRQLGPGAPLEEDARVGDDARTGGAGTEQPASLGLPGHRAAGLQDPNGLAPRDEHAPTLGRPALRRSTPGALVWRTETPPRRYPSTGSISTLVLIKAVLIGLPGTRAGIGLVSYQPSAPRAAYPGLMTPSMIASRSSNGRNADFIAL